MSMFSGVADWREAGLQTHLHSLHFYVFGLSHAFIIPLRVNIGCEMRDISFYNILLFRSVFDVKAAPTRATIECRNV